MTEAKEKISQYYKGLEKNHKEMCKSIPARNQEANKNEHVGIDINQKNETVQEKEIVHKEDIRKISILKCTRCHFKAKNAPELKLHLIQIHQSENKECDWEKYFRANFSIEILICSICKEIFNSQKELKNHRKNHESEGNKIEAALSKVISENFKQLSEKINKPCDQCSKYKEECDTLKSLTKLARNQCKNQETQTNEIEKSDFQEVLLETSEINQQNYEVDELPSNEHNSLPRVKKRHNPDTKDQILNKSKRGKKLKIQDNSENNKSHVESENLSDEKSPEQLNKVKQGYPCQVCGVSFTRKPALKKHVETIHEGKIPHKCMFCEQSFNVKSNMTRHINSVHMTDKNLPFSCMNCKKGFKRSDHLKIHEESCE